MRLGGPCQPLIKPTGVCVLIIAAERNPLVTPPDPVEAVAVGVRAPGGTT